MSLVGVVVRPPSKGGSVRVTLDRSDRFTFLNNYRCLAPWGSHRPQPLPLANPGSGVRFRVPRARLETAVDALLAIEPPHLYARGFVRLVLEGASGVKCNTSCLNAHSAITDCTCSCDGLNHGGGLPPGWKTLADGGLVVDANIARRTLHIHRPYVPVPAWQLERNHVA